MEVLPDADDLELLPARGEEVLRDADDLDLFPRGGEVLPDFDDLDLLPRGEDATFVGDPVLWSGEGCLTPVMPNDSLRIGVWISGDGGDDDASLGRFGRGGGRRVVSNLGDVFREKESRFAGFLDRFFFLDADLLIDPSDGDDSL